MRKTRLRKQDQQLQVNKPVLTIPDVADEPQLPAQSPESMEIHKTPRPKESWKEDLIAFMKSELNCCSVDLEVDEKGAEAFEENDYRTERILNLLKVPLKLEIFSWFGYLICLDSFLHLFTILPLKILIILCKLFHHYSFRRSHKGGLYCLSQQQKSDIINGLLIICTCFLLQNVDASRLYHSIRGQAIIKLYVIFNALEICDKLAAAFGHDIMDSLHSYTPKMRTKFNRWIRFLIALAYIYGHTLVLFYQVMSLNVAINSYNNALLTLLISNQFVEIKGSVFKRFEKGNLFQLSCADSVERFQLSIFLLIVTIRNCLEIFGSGALGDLSNALVYYSMGFRDAIISLYHFKASSISVSSILTSAMGSNELKLAQIVIGPYVIVLGTEMIVDWIKHAFIVKFNGLKPNVYDRFMESICRDLLGIKYSSLLERGNHAHDQSAPEIKHDRSPIVSKRIGFISIPIACLIIRIGYQILQIVGIIPETLIGWENGDQPGTGSVSDGPMEDSSIGSWRLPLKLATWIKSRRISFEKAGLSGEFSFLAPAIWIIAFLLLILFKFALGIALLYISRGYLLRKLNIGEQDPKQMDDILNIHTPHHMLPLDIITQRGRSSLALDEIDRFSMVKSRIP